MTKKLKVVMSAGLILATFIGTTVSSAAPNAPKPAKPNWDQSVNGG